MKKSILVFGTTLLLASCASGPSSYQLYADTQAKIAQANAIADTARYNALLEIAKNGDSAAKVAAVLSIQMGQAGAGSRPQQQVAAPEDWDTKLLKWAGVLLPSVTQLYSINSQRQIAVTQSNNAAATAQSTNNTFATMSTNMANSNTNIAKAGFDAVGAANTAISNVATAGITGVNNTANAALTANTALGTAGITGVNNAANAGLTATTNLGTTSINGLITATNNANATITSLGTQASNNITTVTGGYRSALDTAISKLSGTTTTTTTTTTNTTSTNNNVCPVSQILTNGVCQ